MANHLPQKGSPELASRARSFFGLMAHIAREANRTAAHVSYVLSGARTSDYVLKIALRELDRAEAGKFRRAA